MRTFAKVAVAGVAGVTLLKLFTTVLIPVLGMMLGLVALTVKLAVLAAVVFFLWSLIRPRPDHQPDESDMDDRVEIVVEEEEEAVEGE